MKDTKFSPDKLYDAIIIGGGPAGLTAAIYLSRARYKVLVLEKEQFGGQITITDEIVNYPGIGKTSGKQLTDTMRRQAEAFGAECLIAQAKSLDISNDVKLVHTDRGDFYCLGILVATGARPRTIGFKGEEEHKGRGVAYCATCDGEFFTDKEVFVIGGGFAAAEESVFLTKFARHVTILIRSDDFTCASSVADKAKNHEKITVLTNTVAEEVAGENGLDYIRYKNTESGTEYEYRAKEGDFFGVFVFAGYSPDTEAVKDLINLNEHGYIITDSEQRTSAEGVYAAGDVCIKPLRQVVTATSDGALAATALEKYIAHIQQKTGLHPEMPTVKPWREEETKSIGSAPSPDNVFTEDMRLQLSGVFDKMEHKLMLKLYLDSSAISAELKGFIENLVSLTDKLRVTVADENDTATEKPCVRVLLENGTDTGLAFHGVPSGHEFTSFILGLYNASGPGQKLDEDIRKEILNITKSIDMKILVSLSCTMCPELVTACQHIAALNPSVRAEVYDLQHFEKLKKKHNVMSVPCLIINNDTVTFGKKNINQILEIIKKV